MKCCKQFIPSTDHNELWMPCGLEAPYELRGVHLCSEHYIEALEHSAHLDFGQLLPTDHKILLELTCRPPKLAK